MSGYRFAGMRLTSPLELVLQTVRVPVWICLVIITLLLMINVQIHVLRDKVSPESSEQQTPVKRSVVHYEQEEQLFRAESVQSHHATDHATHKMSERKEFHTNVSRKQGKPLGVRPPDLPQQAVNPPQVPEADVEPYSDGEIAALTQVLEMRLARASGGIIGERNCSMLAAMNNVRGTCIDTTCPSHFHPSAEARVRQLLIPRLRVTAQQQDSISAISKDIPRKKYIFVTAASSNHYNESQALIFYMRQFIFGKLHPDEYSFYFYDLGLKPLERRRMVKNCNCTVKSMDFSAFPSHTRHLMCYAWKPIIIKALLPKAEVLVYMDVSIRFRNMNLDQFFATAREWGAQFLNSGDSIPNHTVQSMFNFYGDMPCMYWPFPELLAGFSVLHNEPFVNKLVVDPWVSCALNVSCMCPVDPHAFRICPHKERRVGQCHRFDLSSLTIQMAKLYGDKFGHLVLKTNNPPKVARNHRMAFFTD